LTLYKRMTFFISILLLSLFVAVLGINFLNSKNHVEEQLKRSTKNTAMALSLALSGVGDDKESVKSLIDTIFSRGSYELIALQDSQRAPIYLKKRSESSSKIPSWLKKWLPISAPMEEVLVSGKDRPLRVLLVKADTTEAYQQLYGLFIYLVVLFLLFGFLGVLLLRLILKTVLKSIEDIKSQAEGLLHNKFSIQKELPSIQELRKLAEVMNSVVKRVREIFQRNAEAMKKSQEVLYRDPLTSLFNRRYFQIKLPEYLLANDSRSRGSLVMIRINGVCEANKKIGHKKMDEFFVEFAHILQNMCETVHEPTICRLNGTEVMLVLPVFDTDTAEELARNIMKKTLVLSDRFDVREIVYFSFGITDYVRNESISKLLARVDYALSDAALYNENHITVYKGDKKGSHILGKTEWAELIKSAIKAGKLEPELEPVINLKKGEKVAYSLTFDIRSEAYSYSYGDYLPAVVELGLEHDLVMYELEYLKKNRFTHNALSLEIFAKTLIDSNSYLMFEEAVKEISQAMKGRLFIEISEYDIFTIDPIVIERISNSLKEYGVRFGINRFSGEKGDYGYLKYAAPAYIKMHETLYLDLDGGSKSALSTLLGSLDIKLILTDVHQENLHRLKRDGIQYVIPSQ